jgi:hypothetical protein
MRDFRGFLERNRSLCFIESGLTHQLITYAGRGLFEGALLNLARTPVNLRRA